MKKILIVFALLAIVSGGLWILDRQLNPPSAKKNNNPIIIGFALGSLREERWLRDRDLFIAEAEKLGATVAVAATDYNAEEQIAQIDNFLSQGIKVIVVVPADSEKIAVAIESAHQAGAKIIAYDRMISGAPDFYVSFDSIKVGEMEAASILAVKDRGDFAYIGGAASDNNSRLLKQGSMSVLSDKINAGEISLVLDQFIGDWDPSRAYRAVKNYLDNGGRLDAVVAANDGTAFGVIQALKEKGLAGQIPVSGQDAELSACQRIIAGTQTATVYKPIDRLARQAAEIAADLARGQEPKTNSLTNNGTNDIPSYLLEPVLVNKENMAATVIQDGFHLYDDVYAPAE